MGRKWSQNEIYILKAHSNKISVIWDKNDCRMKSRYYKLIPTTFQSFGTKMVTKWNLHATSLLQQIFSHLGSKWSQNEIYVLQAHSNKFSVIWDKNGRTKKSVCYKLIPTKFQSFGLKMIASCDLSTTRYYSNNLSDIWDRNGSTLISPYQ